MYLTLEPHKYELTFLIQLITVMFVLYSSKSNEKSQWTIFFAASIAKNDTTNTFVYPISKITWFYI